MMRFEKPDDARDYLHRAMSRDVAHVLVWTDLTGQVWIAPHGSDLPDLDRPVPAAWIPVRMMNRQEVEPS